MNSRIQRLRALMEENSLDAVWVSGGVNHLYMSRFDNPDGNLLICRDSAWAFEDFRYTEAAKREADGDFEVVMPEAPLRQWLPGLLAQNGVKTMGYEDDVVTCRSLEELKKACPGVELKPAGELFDIMRVHKDGFEADCIRRAQKIAEKAFEELLPKIRPEITERELAAELEYLMKKNGAHGISFDTIAVSGKNTSSPHGVPGDKPVESGFITFDFGALYRGYHSDMTRTVCLGRADGEMKRLYNTVLRAQTAVLEVICEGISAYKADKIARDIIDGAGYRGAFGHSLGHGVGLKIHEKPNLSPRSGDARLEAGHVVTVEPGIYLEGKYGCRIEDMVLIVPGGAENLTSFPKELIEL